eukprot:CAMPEP_0203748062 /NCGR_PEP_ID=MMETSP0098-20131031/3039_1 /ASSEMBLY_ACC=CAM_ASM_000208 /TAXON_ID=96639 /ORGANISM=" , Strain NY0313808BC1" /LENGTH=845 /DNA_ID=CAMNT_0050636677 /DNA_START=1393 /DNA_END=3930 /DNA_ORIENTATION=+
MPGLIVWSVVVLAVFDNVAGKALYEEPCDECVAQAYHKRICNRNEGKLMWTSNKTQINIAAFRPVHDTGWANHDLDVVLMCALEDINNNPDILPETKMDIVYIHEPYSQAAGIEAGLCMQHHGIPAAIGPISSTTSVGASIIGQVYKLPLVATVASSPVLSDKSFYPYFSRIFPSDAFQGKVLAKIVYQLGFTKVATITTALHIYYEGITNSFVRDAEDRNMTILSVTTSRSSSYEDLKKAFKTIKDAGYRVIMIAQESKLVWDAIVDLEMQGPGYQYFAPEGKWGQNNATQTSLSNGWLGVFPKVDKESAAIKKMYSCVDSHLSDTTGPFANLTVKNPRSNWWIYFYDAAQVMARAMHAMGFDEQGQGRWVGNETGLLNEIRAVEFAGTTGAVKMDSNGDRLGAVYEILNVHDQAREVSIGHVRTDTMEMILDEAAINWAGEIFPNKTLANSNIKPKGFSMECRRSDANIYNITSSTCNPDRIVTFAINKNSIDGLKYCDPFPSETFPCDHAQASNPGYVIALISLLYCGLLSLGILKWWAHGIIKRAQRKFLLLMSIGSILALMTPVITVGETVDWKCKAVPLLATTGYILLFGPLFLKSQRVMEIVGNNKLKNVKVTNKTLFFRLFGIVAINTGIYIAMAVSDPATAKILAKPLTVSVTDTQQETFYVNETHCAVSSSNFSSLFIFFLGTFTLYGCYVSWAIKDIRADFSESKWIFMSIYNGTTWTALSLYMSMGMEMSTSKKFTFGAVGISIVTTMTMSLILIPKYFNIVKGVTFTSSISQAHSATATSSNTTSASIAPTTRANAVGATASSVLSTDPAEVTALKAEVQALKAELEKLKQN